MIAVTILVILLGAALGCVGALLKKLEKAKDHGYFLQSQNDIQAQSMGATYRQLTESQTALRDAKAAVDAKEVQIQGMLEAVHTACADIAVAMPTLEDGEWGLVVLVRKLINELEDAQKYVVQQDTQVWNCREALACPGNEDLVERAKNVSAMAAVTGAIGELLGVDPRFGGEAVFLLCQRLAKVQHAQRHVQDMQTKTADSIRELLKWLNARPDESLRQAVQRVIVTAEVAPGAATELQKCRALLDIPAGQTVLEALREPVEFKATVTKRKGEVVGISMNSVRAWPKIGEVEVVTRDV